ncbi:hypothetical protein HOO68_03605 [Candidatus Gracilibacteria bacterium]|nr:hypothetical protein [Candidatus Gracilibacteria bacterium]
MSKGKILAYIFSIIALIFEGFFGIIPFLQFAFRIIIIAIAIFLLNTIVRSIFKRGVVYSWKEILPQYILTILATIGFFTAISLSFITYQNATPGVLSDISLSNSGQEVVFIEMSHIATPEFYTNKKEAIAALAQSGYTIIMEGVKPGTPENQALFNQSIGFDFTPTLYSEIANIIGLQSQDNKMLFEGINTGSLVSVDLSIDEIISLMGTGIVTSTGEVVDIESEIQKTLSALTSRERIFTGWIARGFMNWSLKQSDDMTSVLTSGSGAQLFTTIIDRRNDKIIEYIQGHPDQNIAVVYGALHFNGVYEALQRANPTWKMKQIKKYTPYNNTSSVGFKISELIF